MDSAEWVAEANAKAKAKAKDKPKGPFREALHYVDSGAGHVATGASLLAWTPPGLAVLGIAGAVKAVAGTLDTGLAVGEFAQDLYQRDQAGEEIFVAREIEDALTDVWNDSDTKRTLDRVTEAGSALVETFADDPDFPIYDYADDYSDDLRKPRYLGGWAHFDNESIEYSLWSEQGRPTRGNNLKIELPHSVVFDFVTYPWDEWNSFSELRLADLGVGEPSPERIAYDTDYGKRVMDYKKALKVKRRGLDRLSDVATATLEDEFEGSQIGRTLALTGDISDLSSSIYDKIHGQEEEISPALAALYSHAVANNPDSTIYIGSDIPGWDNPSTTWIQRQAISLIDWALKKYTKDELLDPHFPGIDYEEVADWWKLLGTGFRTPDVSDRKLTRYSLEHDITESFTGQPGTLFDSYRRSDPIAATYNLYPVPFEPADTTPEEIKAGLAIMEKEYPILGIAVKKFISANVSSEDIYKIISNVFDTGLARMIVGEKGDSITLWKALAAQKKLDDKEALEFRYSRRELSEFDLDTPRKHNSKFTTRDVLDAAGKKQTQILDERPGFVGLGWISEDWQTDTYTPDLSSAINLRPHYYSSYSTEKEEDALPVFGPGLPTFNTNATLKDVARRSSWKADPRPRPFKEQLLKRKYDVVVETWDGYTQNRKVYKEWLGKKTKLIEDVIPYRKANKNDRRIVAQKYQVFNSRANHPTYTNARASIPYRGRDPDVYLKAGQTKDFYRVKAERLAEEHQSLELSYRHHLETRGTEEERYKYLNKKFPDKFPKSTSSSSWWG